MDKKMEYRVINLAGDVGEILLENGSEIYRVENSICEISEYFGFSPQCFATLTCIIVTLEDSNGEIISIVRRVKQRNTNLDKVYKVYSLVKNLEGKSIEMIEEELKKIVEEKPYSLLTNLFGNCIGAAFFSVLFLGDSKDFIASAISGLIVAIFLRVLNRANFGIFFINLICGFIATISACFFHSIGFTLGASITIISTLMILAPGVAFINSMRDIFSGDLVTGMSRLMEVVAIGISIAVGSGIALNLYLRLGGTV